MPEVAPRQIRPAGHVLAARSKNGVTWQARISADRGRLEVVGIVPPSAAPTVIEPLDERELRELLGERSDLHDDGGVTRRAGEPPEDDWPS